MQILLPHFPATPCYIHYFLCRTNHYRNIGSHDEDFWTNASNIIMHCWYRKFKRSRRNAQNLQDNIIQEWWTDVPVSLRKWTYIKKDIPKRNSGIEGVKGQSYWWQLIYIYMWYIHVLTLFNMWVFSSLTGSVMVFVD
jgi:hypothetical protein